MIGRPACVTGEMPARYVSGRAALLALVLRRLEELVGSRRAAALAKKLAALA